MQQDKPDAGRASRRAAAAASLEPALYVVATPIGHLDDISLRALDVLRRAGAVLAEDTRNTKHLLSRHGIGTALRAVHEHNEAAVAAGIAAQIAAGESFALVSDAGTPLVSDPGYRLVNESIAQGVTVIPVPGASAVLAALAASGLPTDRFVFEGFLSPRRGAREAALGALAREPRTVVLFEAPHRLADLLADIEAVLGPARRVCLARELTKRFETFLRGTAAEVRAQVDADPDQRRGECVVLVGGDETEPGDGLPAEACIDVPALLAELVKVLPVKEASRIVAERVGVSRRLAYAEALKHKPG